MNLQRQHLAQRWILATRQDPCFSGRKVNGQLSEGQKVSKCVSGLQWRY